MKINLRARTKNTAKNTAVGLISQLIQIVSSFLCRMVFVRVLSQAYLGVNGLFGNVLSILSIGELGIGSAITFELYKALAYGEDEEVKSLMSFYRRAYVLIGILMTIAGLLCVPVVYKIVPSDPAIHEDIRILYLFFLFNTVISYFFSYRISIIQAAQQNYVLTLVHTAVTVLQNITQIIVLIKYRNFLMYLSIQSIATFAYYFISSIIAGKMFPILKEKNIKPLPKEQKDRMFINTKDIFITSCSGKLVSQTDNIIITALGGLAATGLNSNYSLLIATLISFTSKINDAIQGSIGNVNAVESDQKKLELFDEIHFFFFWFYSWCTICFILLVQDVISIFFGADYLMSFGVAVITGINFYTTEQGGVVGIFKQTMGLFRYGKYMAFVTGIINIILSVVLGKHYGVFGILLASFISIALTTRWYNPYVTFRYGLHVSPLHYFLNDFRYWIEGIVCFLAAYCICSKIEFPIVINLFLKLIVCIIIPNLIIVIIHHNDYYFKQLKTRIMKIFSR